MSEKLLAAQRVIAMHLTEIEDEVFKPDAGMRLTFVARDPTNPEADMIVSSEQDLDDLIALVERCKTREKIVPPTEL